MFFLQPFPYYLFAWFFKSCVVSRWNSAKNYMQIIRDYNKCLKVVSLLYRGKYVNCSLGWKKQSFIYMCVHVLSLTLKREGRKKLLLSLLSIKDCLQKTHKVFEAKSICCQHFVKGPRYLV